MAEKQAAAREIAARLGVSVLEAEWRTLDRFWSLLLTWNARINLTGAHSREELVGEHLPDALAMARLVPQGVRVLDVGSGGGLPAIPFAVLRPDVELTMVEPRAKRGAFLRTACREVVLERSHVLVERIEEMAPREVDVACSRATFPPAEWLERARVLAPAVVVFAARRAEIAEPTTVRLEGELTYETAARHPRWLGLFRST